MPGNYFLSVCLNPVIRKTIVLKHLWENEVNRSSEYHFETAGKGVNTNKILSKLGENSYLLTFAGGLNKEYFKTQLESEKIAFSLIDAETPIRFSYLLYNREKKTKTEIIEEEEPITSGTEEKILAEYLKILPDSHTVIFSGTKAMGFSDEMIPQMIAEAKKNGKNVILEIVSKEYSRYIETGPDVIFQDLKGFLMSYYPGYNHNENDVTKEIFSLAGDMMSEIYNKYGTTVVLSGGKYGTVFYKNNEAAINAEELQTEPGDAFITGFSSTWFKTRNAELGVKFGIECSGKIQL
jgi:fructose-1-phosphate kinase PfkB-like protein